ncbi:bifunctional (p)ppGpp synthetase/guanosine-3',5'-bis(diphosphate) 3'-pyrophosphohydrolase [Bariatricus massiliensis]|uniref:GTP diphosphokinase n=1 Tax=Bariatricus massiliensis TaxID=1745713 RepID=A0ABS8DF40_9FIRM|nr:bifunctional (p)ppGpp synthetase/guanosine-3',5'-bis(diphosphate) 3'-pyrophosphohydrolase [Bariatricus massiliensis]MCB7303109.1 bifunctional (p)ppGpp synthetase/guanosine-3',5'-bis(diphosphate) 3'-pyrophosphohydrolase [Bariatricus massiliensis]MCB7374325.1 bifunctional (p)ppGpp synthetase/guanosine-3',5'-bis(diphosphate) 3'-pyrophosphohydrolase [Bariatricus massiliensis]MCB7386995.1 bifunctional (p)ppGpp synthetase/guanosine-3',5'-bis(diphosphate) 3'-pyrophosphohydrolase [Bariatricus massili
MADVTVQEANFDAANNHLELVDGHAVKAPADYQNPDELYNSLIERVRKYHPSADVSMIEKAYRTAKAAHEGQKRKSGEDYIIHPLWVSIILAQLEMDKETIVAGMLHDAVEDTIMTDEEIRKEFGDEVALLVDGVTKLGQLSYSSDKLEVQAENLRKMFLAMAKDIRVIIIKLADRLHNMRTLQFMRPEKQKEKAKETMDIYAPIAQRLGISKIKTELDDLALKYSQPEVFYDLVKQINARQTEREEFVQQIVNEVSQHMKNANIDAEVNGRVKHFFSIYKKMVNQDKTVDQIYDLFAVRIIVDSVKDCYAALGVIHEMYTPVPGRFKDYIAMPKPNMYQSLHTTLMSSVGQPFEIQIRTEEMHKTAEYGIAAHWKYKETDDGKKSVEAKEEEKLSWLRQILEWQRDMSDNREFLNLLKGDLDLFAEDVYCFTPNGDVKNLPNGSTPIDFAYAIHTAVGNKMVGARVNGKLVNIDYKIQNGDRIEILTSQNSKGPSRDWLNIVKSTQAKNKINQWFKKEFKEENIIRGKEMLASYCKSKGFVLSDLTKPKYMQVVQEKYGFRDWESILAALGHGGLKEGQIVNRLAEEYGKDHKKELTDESVLEKVAEAAKNRIHITKSKSGIVVKGIDDMAVRFSRCCNPVPGDEIVGFITRGRGMSIHRTDCVNIIHLSEAERARLITAEWEKPAENEGGRYLAEIKMYANDRQGLLMDMSKVFTEMNLDVKSMNVRTNKQGTATIEAGFIVGNKDDLLKVTKKLRQLEGVLDIERAVG